MEHNMNECGMCDRHTLILEFPAQASALWLLPVAQVQDESLDILPVLLVIVLMMLALMCALASALLDVYGVVPVVRARPGNQEDIEVLQSQGVVPLTTASTAQSVSPLTATRRQDLRRVRLVLCWLHRACR